METTSLCYPQPLHHQLPLYSCRIEPPRVHRPVSLHRVSSRLESSQFLVRPPAPPNVREASYSSTPKSGFQSCIFGKASAVSPPTLQAWLVILFLGWNKALYILLIILHLFCLHVCLPNIMLSPWEQVCCYSSPPLPPSPVPGTLTKAFGSPEKFL